VAFSQVPDSIFMVRPACFGFNSDTASTNAFQNSETEEVNVQALALGEFELAVETIRKSHIEVLIGEDSIFPKKPDAIFPNNWFSIHSDGKLVLYPMMALNRRLERSQNFINLFKSKFGPLEIVDLSFYESQGRFLEGTGSIVFDHLHKIAYACHSPRTDESVLEDLCSRLGYTPFMFHAEDENGKPIYHTNVMLCVGEKVVVVCLDSIKNQAEQEGLLASFTQTGHRVVAISYGQMRRFAGNMIEVQNNTGKRFLLLSQNAMDSLLPERVTDLSRFVELLPVHIPTIEKYGGGGVRCMVAGIHKKQMILN
jgi:hypothetical protein